MIHGAVYQPPAGRSFSQVALVDEMLEGSWRVLGFCAAADVRNGMEKIPEDFSASFDPADGSHVYHQVRRMMESLTVLHAKENGFEAKIARCFSFIGPYLPLDGRFAVGDFIQVDLPLEIIRRRRDIMIESAAYNIIKQEGIEEGIEQGIEKGIDRAIRKMFMKGVPPSEIARLLELELSVVDAVCMTDGGKAEGK